MKGRKEASHEIKVTTDRRRLPPAVFVQFTLLWFCLLQINLQWVEKSHLIACQTSAALSIICTVLQSFFWGYFTTLPGDDGDCPWDLSHSKPVLYHCTISALANQLLPEEFACWFSALVIALVLPALQSGRTLIHAEKWRWGPPLWAGNFYS